MSTDASGDQMGEDDLAEGQVPITALQEHFSVSFTRMIAYAAGCSIKPHETDYEGVDITIVSSCEYHGYYGPQFELQLKCTHQESLLKDDSMTWRMKAKPFRKLTRGKRFIPAYLGVLLIPREPEPWLNVDDWGLFTRSRMFWESAENLRHDGPIKDYHTVHLPRRNLFTVDQLRGIMKSIGDAEEGQR
ncbi:hypothetical protein GCM10018790_00610 [Kitasatospora xanthocidica]|uniref:DUF4365 domain-containing protein n=1 Tax=Kitasatospora xanthocidica TaxID=83382 RepID=UPI001671A0C5|nr:DUF4365 domain-containing protein [Kitasatospora xanthocidica]GHF27224.1 hypothetical protein GCM10018790_00610 [Kitasatospora xanthocidica]